MRFDLDSESRRRLGNRLIALIDQYFASLPDRPVQLPAAQRSFEPLHNPLPEMGAETVEEVERLLEDVTGELIEKGFHVPSASYFGLMNPTPAYIGVLGELLVAALNPQLATMARSQLASKIEQETLRWLGERIWPGAAMVDAGADSGARAFAGTFTSGGNEANFTALAAALAAAFPGAIEQGVASIGAQPLLYCSAEAHHSIDKSAGLLGIGRQAVRRIAVNDHLQLDPAELVKQVERDRAAGARPFCVVATAGTTNSGAVDDTAAIAAIVRRFRMWLHVDGAYGAAAAMSERHRDLVRGIELADSVTVDPHKWLAMPFAAGVILTCRPQALRAAFEVSTPYMPRPTQPGVPLPIDNFKISTQWTRRANALKLWLTLRVHGRRAFEEHFERQLQLARGFAAWVRQSPHFELVVEPALTIVNLRARGASEAEVSARNNDIVDDVTRDGRQWISVTQVAGRSVIRVMVISYLTDQRHLDMLQESLTRAAERVSTITPQAAKP